MENLQISYANHYEVISNTNEVIITFGQELPTTNSQTQETTIELINKKSFVLNPALIPSFIEALGQAIEKRDEVK